MHFTTSTALAASLVGLAAASTVPMEVRDKKSFSVQQVHVGKKIRPAPAVAMMNAYAKFGKQAAAPVQLQKAAKAQATGGQQGTVAAVPEAYDQVRLNPSWF